MQLSHWGFTLSAQYVRAQRDLWGEKISWGEDFNLIDLTYNWKQWGRQKRQANKLINVSGDTDRSTAGGR